MSMLQRLTTTWVLGDIKEAKDYYDRALDIRLKKPGPEHVDV